MAGIGDFEAIIIAESLNSNTGLKSLSLIGNKIGNVGAAALAKALRHNNRLEVLSLQENQIGNTGAKELLSSLNFNFVPRKFLLFDNPIEFDFHNAVTIKNNRNIDLKARLGRISPHAIRILSDDNSFGIPRELKKEILLFRIWVAIFSDELDN